MKWQNLRGHVRGLKLEVVASLSPVCRSWIILQKNFEHITDDFNTYRISFGKMEARSDWAKPHKGLIFHWPIWMNKKVRLSGNQVENTHFQFGEEKHRRINDISFVWDFVFFLWKVLVFVCALSFFKKNDHIGIGYRLGVSTGRHCCSSSTVQ